MKQGKEITIDRKLLLENLKGDFTSAQKKRTELDAKIAKWKKEYNGEFYGNEREGRSVLISRDIKKQSEWQHSALIEPFVSTPDIIQANPGSFEDAKKAPLIELLLNTQFCRQFNRYNFMTKVIKLLDQEGTCIVRTGWEYEEKVVKEQVEEEIPNPQLVELQQVYQQIAASDRPDRDAILQQIQEQAQQLPQTVMQKRIIQHSVPIKNQPTAMVCRNEDVFIDPTCGDSFDDAQFIIYRYETTLSVLRSQEKYSNLEQVEKVIKETNTDNYKYMGEEVSFEFKDIPRKKLVVYEYWGYYDVNNDGIVEPIVCTWVNDIIIQLDFNPFPDEKPPFIIAPFSPIPFTLYGESNAELLSDVQKIKTAIYRGFIDNMALSNNGQKGIRLGALDSVNKRKFLEGENFEFQGTRNDFYDGNFNELPGSIFNFLQLMNNEAESITGVASYNSGINGSALGESATSVRAAVDSAASRRLNTVRNISENLVKPLLRKWLAYSAEFLDEEAQFRITNDEFVWLKREDLEARVDIDLNISTSDDNQAKASELAFMLQTIGPHEDPEVRKMIMVKIARLYRMPELAKELQSYQPQPDPMQQRIMELQAQLLEAQVMNEQAKAGENEVDRQLKGAKTQTELAKAKTLSAQADKIDLDYLQQFHGVDNEREERARVLEQQYQLARDMLKYNAQNKKTNL